MRNQPIIIANWKMHKTSKEAALFMDQLLPSLEGIEAQVYVAPPFTSIEAAYQASKGSKVQIGAQNMSEHPKGAYTGEISAEMIKAAGGSFVLLGHSERRFIYQETDETIHSKLKAALLSGLQPILCIGETAEERNSRKTTEILEGQLSAALKNFTPGDFHDLVIAYEPVWAIGTGLSATPEMAQEAHKACRDFLKREWGDATAEKTPILYGGSVKPDNIKQLIQQNDIDGALVGGASLEVESFQKILTC